MKKLLPSRTELAIFGCLAVLCTGIVGVGSIPTVTSAHPPARAPTQSRIDVLFRPSGHAPFMSNVEYLSVRTSDGSVVLSVVVLSPLERLRRFLKRS